MSTQGILFAPSRDIRLGVESVSFSQDGSTIVSGSWDNTVRLWNVNTGEPIKTLTEHTTYVKSVVFSPMET